MVYILGVVEGYENSGVNEYAHACLPPFWPYRISSISFSFVLISQSVGNFMSFSSSSGWSGSLTPAMSLTSSSSCCAESFTSMSKSSCCDNFFPVARRIFACRASRTLFPSSLILTEVVINDVVENSTISTFLPWLHFKCRKFRRLAVDAVVQPLSPLRRRQPQLMGGCFLRSLLLLKCKKGGVQKLVEKGEWCHLLGWLILRTVSNEFCRVIRYFDFRLFFCFSRWILRLRVI